MAEKRIIWEIMIGRMWVEVHEETFIRTMRILCDTVHLCEGKTRIALFVDREGRVVGKMYCKEV